VATERRGCLGFLVPGQSRPAASADLSVSTPAGAAPEPAALTYPYTLRAAFLSQGETAFYRELELAVGTRYAIFPRSDSWICATSRLDR